MDRQHRFAGAVAAATILLGTAVAPVAHADADATHYTGALADGGSWVADVPRSWNGTLILFSHGYGPEVAEDAPMDATGQDLLGLGYALVGPSYSGPSSWALASAVNDQFAATDAVERIVGAPRRVIAWGQSMGGLVSALEAQRGHRRLAGALTTCGLVAGALNLNNYQLDGEYALSRLLAPNQPIQLVNYADASQALTAATRLDAATTVAQTTAQGRARTALGAALMNEPTWFTGQRAPAPTDFNAQEAQQAQELTLLVLPFVMYGRTDIERSAGGNSSFTVGVDYANLLRHSPQQVEVQALYREAGLDLDADLDALTRDASIGASQAAIASLTETSVPTGKLAVPEIDIHTIADQLIPFQQENWYADRVARAGDGGMLRQAFVGSTGHCNFQPTQTIAALHALEHRIDTGRWDDAVTPAALNVAARATGLGPAAPYVPITPPVLTGARER